MAPSGNCRDGAQITGGRLLLPTPGAWFDSEPISRDLREKTLEAWVCLAEWHAAGGAVLAIGQSDGGPFDAIVLGPQPPRRWTVESDAGTFSRELGGPPEDAPPGAWVHLAATWSAEGQVTLYRNGEPYGSVQASGKPPRQYTSGKARVTLGRRHERDAQSGPVGAVRLAALHDRALSAAEVRSAFQSGGAVVPDAEILAALDPRQRLAREAALQQLARARDGAARDGRAPRVAYAGLRQQPAPTPVLKRGDVKSPGDIVAPAGLSAIATLPSGLGLGPDAPESARRLQFAEWLADPRNPLPARVLVNRVWQFHFGQGLVATPSDFGVSGARPSHPELLDWLASEFIAGGWSLKALHRRIVTSATYRQASEFRPEAAAVDADNQLLWRYAPRRLEAEAVRDALLAVSGEIQLQIGGPSFRPFTTSNYGATFYHLFDRDEPEFNRRTIYRMNINSGKEPLLDALDCPDPSVKTPRRGVTTTPLQALGLMNSSFVQRQAARLAARALAAADNDPDRAVDVAWRLALGRPATPDELARSRAAARDRGLASVCWVLLNATEFVYVR